MQKIESGLPTIDHYPEWSNCGLKAENWTLHFVLGERSNEHPSMQQSFITKVGL